MSVVPKHREILRVFHPLYDHIRYEKRDILRIKLLPKKARSQIDPAIGKRRLSQSGALCCSLSAERNQRQSEH